MNCRQVIVSRLALAHRRRTFFTLAFVFMLAAFTLILTGCMTPTWLTDAGSILTLVGASFTSIASFIAGLTGNAALATALAAVSAWITKVQTGISDIEALVDQYSVAPDPTVLTDIESALVDVQANVQTDFGNLGLPAAVFGVIAGIAELADQQLTAWGSLLGAAKASSEALKPAVVSVSVPLTKAQFKAGIDKILTTPTGDPMVDAALAKAKKI